MFQGTSDNVEPSAFIVTSDALERRFNQVEKSDLGLDWEKADEVKRRGVRRCPISNGMEKEQPAQKSWVKQSSSPSFSVFKLFFVCYFLCFLSL